MLIHSRRTKPNSCAHLCARALVTCAARCKSQFGALSRLGAAADCTATGEQMVSFFGSLQRTLFAHSATMTTTTTTGILRLAATSYTCPLARVVKLLWRAGNPLEILARARARWLAPNKMLAQYPSAYLRPNGRTPTHLARAVESCCAPPSAAAVVARPPAWPSQSQRRRRRRQSRSRPTASFVCDRVRGAR